VAARKKVAVLGGGIGAISTAFELTATEQLRERFEVTVYQPGWRLGGKGASGRNMAQGGRIEEHGLHIWFGFYDNAFRMMREAYQQLGRPPEAPLATLEDAFKGCDQIVLYDRDGEDWRAFPINAPRNFQRPGVPRQLPTFWEVAARTIDWALERYRELLGERPEIELDEPPEHYTPAWFADLTAELGAKIARTELAGAEHLLHLAGQLTKARSRETDQARPEHAAHHWLLVKLVTGFRDWLWKHVVEERCERDPDLRFYFTTFDTVVSMISGIVEDGVLEHGFDAINDEEWADWLARHGAKQATIGPTPAERAPVLRAMYDVAFCYPGGEVANADVAAGAATNDLLRLLFTYRGSLMYKMQAGMGDTVFGPFYEVLKRRGVRFEFFHAVTHLGLSPGGEAIETIDVVPQVELTASEYEPLVDVKGLPCWPSEPLWEQLVDGERLRADVVDFESQLNPLDREPLTLRRGEDFDEVVLGISVGALAPICGELAEHSEPFRRMLETSATVRTQAFQLWLKEPAEALGWAHSGDSVAGCYVEPLDTYCEMSHLLPREDWREEHGVKSVAYFCGVLDDREGESEAEAHARVKANASEFLASNVGALWPQAIDAPPATAIRWELLADGTEGSGEARLDAQYWRANTSSSERYVLTPAGSVKHRLPSDRSGFENLVLAGDWTKNGIDGGCVEAAATSGIQAARALIGHDRPIVGEDPAWLAPPVRGLPRYVEFGGRATTPGPFKVRGGRVRGFLLDGDRGRIADLVERTFNEPAGEGVDYRPLSDRVLLVVGSFDRISSTVPPWDHYGTIREIQASFFVPVVAGRDHGSVFTAERLCLAVPYILVDNAMSYLAGREDYGYPKTLGRFTPEEEFAPDRPISGPIRIDAYGGDFEPDQQMGWRPLIEIARADGGGGAGSGLGEVLEGARGLASLLTGGALDDHDGGELVLPGLKLGGNLLRDALDGRATQVFLKQFRDAEDGSLACYQSIVEAPVHVTRLKPRPSLDDWEVTIHPIDSHPIARDLGIETQVAGSSVDMELEFLLDRGEVVAPLGAPATASPGAAPRAPGPGDSLTPEMGPRAGAHETGSGAQPGLTEEVFGLFQATAGRLYRELSALRRITRR
jgi:uncharacterized protein with NAD-binding domain and iron-sulfur cluster